MQLSHFFTATKTCPTNDRKHKPGAEEPCGFIFLRQKTHSLCLNE